MSDTSLRLGADKLIKSYGDIQALKGISFSIDKPGVVAILGQNGAGKTSLIKCALGLEKISAGAMTTMGNKPGSLAAKLQTGVILQDTDLPDLLSVREHITLFASYYPNALPIDEVIATCELSDFAHKRYKKLSGGQKRRVQFALAIVGDPPLIFLDEPTTGLDIEARRNFWTVIREFAKRGKTIVLTTHYLEEADNLADRIIVLNQGQIVTDTTPDKLHGEARGSVIRCQSTASVEQLEALPAIANVSLVGRLHEIRSVDVNLTLKALLALDPQLSNLTVSQPKLEDIFSELSKSGDAA